MWYRTTLIPADLDAVATEMWREIHACFLAWRKEARQWEAGIGWGRCQFADDDVADIERICRAARLEVGNQRAGRSRLIAEAESALHLCPCSVRERRKWQGCCTCRWFAQPSRLMEIVAVGFPESAAASRA